MTIIDMILPEFDQESSGVRKTLEIIPAHRLEWQPHPKSMSMAGLATHLVNIYCWVPLIMEHASLDLAPNGIALPRMTAAQSVAELTETFSQNLQAARAAIVAADDAKFLCPWSLLMNSHEIFTLPRHVALRSTILNHLIHHRAQLGVYLRLNEVAVPGMYGPSADEKS